MDSDYKFTSINEKLTIEMHKYREKADLSEWMTKEKTTFIQKDSLKRTTQNNYRPITCQTMMQNILTV